jgi:hypothetical protein
MDTEILDASGDVIVARSRIIEASAFADGPPEHRYELPVADLATGDYLLRFLATRGDIRAQRDVRFSVR